MDPVVLLERLRFVDGEPWALTTTYLPHHRVPGLEHEDLTDQSLYALLESRYQIRLARGRRSVEAIAAGEALAAALDVPVGAPVLALRSLSFDAEDRPVESFLAYHRGDRSRFEVELIRPGQSRSNQGSSRR